MTKDEQDECIILIGEIHDLHQEIHRDKLLLLDEERNIQSWKESYTRRHARIQRLQSLVTHWERRLQQMENAGK
jgi:hypothetical protein